MRHSREKAATNACKTAFNGTQRAASRIAHAKPSPLANAAASVTSGIMKTALVGHGGCHVMPGVSAAAGLGEIARQASTLLSADAPGRGGKRSRVQSQVDNSWIGSSGPDGAATPAFDPQPGGRGESWPAGHANAGKKRGLRICAAPAPLPAMPT